MKYLYPLIAILICSCGVNFHQRMARYHERMAYAKGAEYSVDTVYKDRIVYVPEVRVDTIISDFNFTDTIVVEKERVITKIKVNLVEKKVYVSTVLKPDTIIRKEKYYINRRLTAPEKENIIKWWWLLIALGVGYVVRIFLR